MSPQIAKFLGKNCDFEKLVLQRFSIPSSILYYVTRDPATPIVYQKFIQSCKYFYAVNPIYIVDVIRIIDGVAEIHQGDDKGMPYLVIKPHQILCKLWVTQTAYAGNLTDVATETLLHKMFRVNAFAFHSLTGNSTTVKLESILRPKTSGPSGHWISVTHSGGFAPEMLVIHEQ